MLIFILLYVLVSLKDSHGRFDEWGSDYFSEDFDDQKNCKDKDLVKKLDKEGKCASTSKGEILYIFILYTGCPTIEYSLCFGCFLGFQCSYRSSSPGLLKNGKILLCKSSGS